MSDFPELQYPEYEGLPAAKLGECMEALDLEITQVEEKLKALKGRYEHIVIRKLPTALEAEGLKNFRLASGRGVTCSAQLFVSVNAGDKEAFLNWLENSGQGGIIKRDVAPQTLKAFIKERIQNAQEYPADIVKVTIVPKARFFK